jgi:hypothetical protein
MEAIELHEIALTDFAAGRWAEAEETALQSLEAFAREDGPLSPDVANLSNLLSEIAEARAQYAAAASMACGGVRRGIVR